MATIRPIVPHHVAIVMDGNGRWASRRFLPRIAGHKQGVASLTRCVKARLERGIGVLTVFAFSSENWNRPADEVSVLTELLALSLAKEVPSLKTNGVQLHLVGDRQRLSEKVQAGLAQSELGTASNQGLVLNVCFNYGGRWDIAQAAQKLASRGEAITELSLDRPWRWHMCPTLIDEAALDEAIAVFHTPERVLARPRHSSMGMTTRPMQRPPDA